MSPTLLFTAIPLASSEDDTVETMISQPLLEMNQIIEEEGGGDDDDGDDNEEEEEEDCDWHYRAKSIAMGALAGFLTQIISWGAFALMLIQNRKLQNASTSNDGNPKEDQWWKQLTSSVDTDCLMHTVLTALTHIDMVIFISMWIAIIYKITTCRGIKLRNPTIAWFSLLIGMILGALATSFMIGVYLGFASPLLLVVASFGIDVVFCYWMAQLISYAFLLGILIIWRTDEVV